MPIEEVIGHAQEYMISQDLEGWLVYDYRGMNPILTETLGPISDVTRASWLWVPSSGEPKLLLIYVDQGRFTQVGIGATLFMGRADMVAQLTGLLSGLRRIAMEYSPNGELPRVSKVDAGTLELVKSLGVEVTSSADLVQYATQRWSDKQLQSHRTAAEKLDRVVQDAFRFIGETLTARPTEFQVAEFIRGRFVVEGLEVTDGPIVAVNEHASDPHFAPAVVGSSAIAPGDWVLIYLWGRMAGGDHMFGDITWTAYVGEFVPAPHQKVFDAVIGARDGALAELEAAFRDGRALQGWQLDDVARSYIGRAGYGDHFNHRLGHSLGREVHSNAVNLDGWETHDTRQVVPGIAVTIEPGIYLPEFGVRSEIDVYIGENGPIVTTSVQRSVVRIGSQ